MATDSTETEALIQEALDRMAREMDKAIFLGDQTVAAPSQSPPLTFEKLKALYDYLKPEKLTVAGEEIEIYGYNVHREHNPPGMTILTEKGDPNAAIPKLGKFVIINEAAGSALVYDPPPPLTIILYNRLKWQPNEIHMRNVRRRLRVGMD